MAVAAEVERAPVGVDLHALLLEGGVHRARQLLGGAERTIVLQGAAPDVHVADAVAGHLPPHEVEGPAIAGHAGLRLPVPRVHRRAQVLGLGPSVADAPADEEVAAAQALQLAAVAAIGQCALGEDDEAPVRRERAGPFVVVQGVHRGHGIRPAPAPVLAPMAHEEILLHAVGPHLGGRDAPGVDQRAVVRRDAGVVLRLGAVHARSQVHRLERDRLLDGPRSEGAIVDAQPGAIGADGVLVQVQEGLVVPLGGGVLLVPELDVGQVQVGVREVARGQLQGLAVPAHGLGVVAPQVVQFSQGETGFHEVVVKTRGLG